jgi:small subunit ribosomal protein S11
MHPARSTCTARGRPAGRRTVALHERVVEEVGELQRRIQSAQAARSTGRRSDSHRAWRERTRWTTAGGGNEAFRDLTPAHPLSVTPTMSATLARLTRAAPRAAAASPARAFTRIHAPRTFATSAARRANDGTLPPVLEGTGAAVAAEDAYTMPEHFGSLYNPDGTSAPPSTDRGPPTAPAFGYPASIPTRPRAFNPLKGDAPLDTKLSKPTTAQWQLHVQCSPNNTIVTFTDAAGASFRKAWFSGGSCGFKGANRNGYEAGYQCASRVFKRVEEQLEREFPDAPARPVQIEIFFKGFGKGRDAFLSALTMTEGESIRDLVVRLTDRTPIKIGGTRAKKMKRR